MFERSHRARAGPVLLVVLAGALLLARAADEGTVLRKIKSDVFDQRWSDVLADCDEFIANFPRSHALPRAYYYRAQALESLHKSTEAIKAYQVFLERFPTETGALHEDALLSRITLATSLYKKGDKSQTRIILEGMDLTGYPRIYSAVQASKIDHTAARRKAIGILKDCASNETDAEVKDECVVALLRIAPQEVPERRAGTAPEAGGHAKLIRVEVFDKRQNKVTVRVNLPIAFAELALESLGQYYREQINKQLFPEGGSSMPDLEKFWKAIKQGGKQTLVEIDDEHERIKVWIE